MSIMQTNSDFRDTFFVLDFDRCTGDTDGIQAVLEEVLLNMTGVTPARFHAARTQIEATGQTFDTIRHVHRLLEEAGSNVTWPQVRERLLEVAKTRDLLLPHARELFALLRERNIHHGIITYGVEEAWQLTKLEAAGLLDTPHLVTRIEEKGKLLSGWKRENGRFAIPPALAGELEVGELVFIDDKARSFKGIPDGVRGVHVIAPGGNLLPVQQGEVPKSVTDVTGIDGVMELLFTTYY
jgi:hypothetical protein